MLSGYNDANVMLLFKNGLSLIINRLSFGSSKTFCSHSLEY